jgi:hypothetical protein
MAKITAAADERIVGIHRWLGLNQTGEGATQLKNGEAAEMTNFRVTADGLLKKRPGRRTIVQFGDRINGAWHGYVNGVEHTVVAAGNRLYDVDAAQKTYTDIGATADTHTEFFGFSEKLYILNGQDYKVWDGTTLADVEGYVPVVVIGCPPSGGGTELEGINRLSASRRIWFSPDGSATAFTLPETAVSVAHAINRATKQELTATLEADGVTVTITPAPAKGTDTIEIQYAVATDGRSGVGMMRFAELYNGTGDGRVFLYGDGTNRAIYSGIDYDGQPTAEYFPELNVLDIGDANTPITAMIRHYSRLLAFKEDSTYSVVFGQITLPDGRLTAAFYWNPVNKAVGNAAPGQVRLVDNDPITVYGQSLYRWVNSGGYSSNITIDERQARRISDRVWRECNSMLLKLAYCFDDNDRKEWYCVEGNRALVYNYGVDCWYLYDNFPVEHMVSFGGRLYGANGDRWCEISDAYRTDDGEIIRAKWASGYMSFGADFRRKYSAMLWVGIEPAVNGEVDVTIETDRKADFTKKAVAANRASFLYPNFAMWSFSTSRRPTIHRLKIKAKKFIYYRLILKNESETSTCTVTAADVRVRFTGYAR